MRMRVHCANERAHADGIVSPLSTQLSNGEFQLRLLHLPWPNLPMEYEKPAPIMMAPAIAFPMVTGIKFCVKTLHQPIGAPANMPAGSRNMFATECSKPMATNMEIGNQMPTILPAKSFAEVA